MVYYNITSVDDFNKRFSSFQKAIVYFSAEWCSTCNTTTPLFLRKGKQYLDIVFLRVDIDKLNELEICKEITGVPTFKSFKNQIKVDEFTGDNEAHLEKLIIALDGHRKIIPGKVLKPNNVFNFNEDFYNSPLVILSFNAELCDSCNKFEPIFEKCAQENPNITFIQVNIDQLHDLPQTKTVSSLPLFRAYKNQTQIKEYIGSNEDHFKQLISTLKSS